MKTKAGKFLSLCLQILDLLPRDQDPGLLLVLVEPDVGRSVKPVCSFRRWFLFDVQMGEPWHC